MTKPRLAFSAFVVGLAASLAWAQDKSADVTVAAPSLGPSAPTTPAVPGSGAAPSLSNPSGVDVSVTQSQSPGVQAQAAPSAAARAAVQPAVRTAASISPAGTRVQAKAQPAPAGGPPAGREQLDSAAAQIGGAGRGQAAGGSAVGENGVFRKIYDDGRAPRAADSAQAGGSGAVLGRQETFGDRVDQIVTQARAASDEAAPGFYAQALDETRQAAKDGVLGGETARKFVARLFGFASPQGRQAIPALAQAAAQAGPTAAAKPLKAIKDWENLFDSFGKPVPKRDARTQALIAIALDHVKAGAVPPAGERAPAADGAGAPAVKALAPIRIPDLEKDAAFPELASSWLDDVLAAHSRNPGADPYLLYQLARRGAGRAVPAAAASAAAQAARAWLAQAWQWLREYYLRYFGPQAAVDLGAGLVVRGPASEVSALSALKRVPSPAESSAKDPRVAVVALDLSAVTRPYAAAMRLLSSQAPPSAPRLTELLAQGEALARTSRELAGDPSGLQAYRALKDRLAGQAQLSPVDARLLGFWLGVLRDAALSRVEAAALAAAGRGGPVVLSDSAKDGLIIAAVPAARGEALERLGFDVAAPRSGGVLARLSLAGLGPSARREALASTVSAAAGHDASAVEGGPERQGAVSLLAFVRSNPGRARDAALQLEAEAPFIRRRFETLGRVTTPQGVYLLERSRRPLAGRLEVIDVLRGESGRAAFARKTFSALPR